MSVVVLSGGVGGARFVRGVVDVVEPRDVTVIGNVGDDLEVLGMHVSPDLDSVLYALAGLADDTRGWGRADETWHALDTVAALGGETWFLLGDRDLGLHLARTQALRGGETLSSARPHPRPSTDRPVSVYRMLSRSGETRRPRSSRSSATLPTMETFPGSTTAMTPRRNRAPPTPPERTATFTPRKVGRESEARAGCARRAGPGGGRDRRACPRHR